jgi:hypothetical protein
VRMGLKLLVSVDRRAMPMRMFVPLARRPTPLS